MNDCETIVAADGCAAEKNLTLVCPLKESQQDSFVVSGFLVDQTVCIHSKIPCACDICEKSHLKIDGKNVFSVVPESKTERTLSVKVFQSASYSISKHISNLIFVTVNAFKRVFSVASRCKRRKIENMKGLQPGCRVYALRLLRL